MMTISEAKDDPLALISGADSGSGDKCFSDDGVSETDCTSVYYNGDDDDDSDWLRNEKERLPEHTTLKRKTTLTHPVFDSDATAQGPRRCSTGSKIIGNKDTPKADHIL
ncbi:hypothetical protein D8B26_008065 [Coccidioides posadasii str. Silveira]|uniref:Uncharacterized protein n=2 Tax=Coccidioides posadasii TaxID=199306 RepID=E9DE24_COCPS|nr:conserved hypothetical protein [Coccidioides posadasii str. Silveira]KMM70340.1 hypothetical protein CPAG_06652 [Coccidioides posadasii RMSCC 3488]QVM13457.1 hypothetical protein D8B26_008065 [Coccidioides posadasii str. Silveira]